MGGGFGMIRTIHKLQRVHGERQQGLDVPHDEFLEALYVNGRVLRDVSLK